QGAGGGGPPRGRLDGVGDALLVAADRLDVAQGDGERRRVKREVQRDQVGGGHAARAKTQNSLPSGSASTSQWTWSSRLRSTVAPRLTNPSTSALTRSQCTRFF